MLNRYAVVAVLAFALPGVAFASADALNVKKGSFAEQRAAINDALTDDQTYAEISDADRTAVVQALDKMERLLRDRSVDQLNQQEKVELFNAQEIVNTKLTQASGDSRIVCQRERIPGSHIRTNVCFTVAERRRMRERDSQALRDAQARPSQAEPQAR